MIVSPPAAHAPFTPAPRHKDVYANIKAPRTISFNFSSPDVRIHINMHFDYNY